MADSVDDEIEKRKAAFPAKREEREARLRKELADRRTASEERREHICFKVGYVLGHNFSDQALVELAHLLHYAQENIGPPDASTFLEELESHEPIRIKEG